MKINILYLFLFTTLSLFSQNTTISGVVTSKGKPLEFVSIYIRETKQGTTTNEKGFYKIENIKEGSAYTLEISMMGFRSQRLSYSSNKELKEQTKNISLKEEMFEVDKIVVTGSKTFKRQTNSPVIVNIIDAKTLSNTQACNLSEGLKFQTGLRVETDCQTCNYTQLRMNGLGGGYSQILVNGRPIFSPLTGLYGLEQIPANMIDRIKLLEEEVLRYMVQALLVEQSTL
jgi:outer membrane receptor for ferrienterochelin and colicins